MNIIKRIRAIMSNETISSEDKLIEIHQTLPKEEADEYEEMPLGLGVSVMQRVGNTVIYDGAFGVYYTDTPLLKDEKDFYYNGGMTWGVDLEGNRYWKRKPGSTDIHSEKGRITFLVKNALKELGIL